MLAFRVAGSSGYRRHRAIRWRSSTKARCSGTPAAQGPPKQIPRAPFGGVPRGTATGARLLCRRRAPDPGLACANVSGRARRPGVPAQKRAREAGRRSVAQLEALWTRPGTGRHSWCRACAPASWTQCGPLSSGGFARPGARGIGHARTSGSSGVTARQALERDRATSQPDPPGPPRTERERARQGPAATAVSRRPERRAGVGGAPVQRRIRRRVRGSIPGDAIRARAWPKGGCLRRRLRASRRWLRRKP